MAPTSSEPSSARRADVSASAVSPWFAGYTAPVPTRIPNATYVPSASASAAAST